MELRDLIIETDQMYLSHCKYAKLQGQAVSKETMEAGNITLQILNALRLAGAKTAEEALALPREYMECRKRYADIQVKSIVERDCFLRKIADLEEELRQLRKGRGRVKKPPCKPCAAALATQGKPVTPTSGNSGKITCAGCSRRHFGITYDVTGRARRRLAGE